MKQGHFHLHTNAVSRSKGHSAVAAAGYQIGQRMTHDKQMHGSVGLDHRKDLNKGRITPALRAELEQNGVTLSDAATAQKEGRREWTIADGDNIYTIREYEKKVIDPETRKQVTESRSLEVYGRHVYEARSREDLKETWVQAANNAPAWIQEMANKGVAVEKKDKEALWNAVEAADVGRNARPARRIQLTFIRELSYDDNKELLREFVDEQFARRGLVADVAIHHKRASDGDWNTHAHILISTREFAADGSFAENKNRYWNKKERVYDWRQAWADKLNGRLEENDSDTRVSHLSYKKRGIDVVPGEHLGPNEWNRSKRGQKTRKAQRNEEIEAKNVQKDKAYEEMAKRIKMRRPEYSKDDIEAYYKKQEREQGADRATYTPDEETLEGSAKRVAAAENRADEQKAQKRKENRADQQKEYFAMRVTRRRWWGLGTTTTETYNPGMSSLPKHVRDKLDKTAERLSDSEKARRLAQYHERTFAGYVMDEKSGGNPAQARENLQRVMQSMREKSLELRMKAREQVSSWRERIRQERGKRDGRERGRGRDWD